MQCLETVQSPCSLTSNSQLPNDSPHRKSISSQNDRRPSVAEDCSLDLNLHAPSKVSFRQTETPPSPQIPSSSSFGDSTPISPFEYCVQKSGSFSTPKSVTNLSPMNVANRLANKPGSLTNPGSFEEEFTDEECYADHDNSIGHPAEFMFNDHYAKQTGDEDVLSKHYAQIADEFMLKERSAGRTSPSTPFVVENFRQISRLRRDLQNIDHENGRHFDLQEVNSFNIAEENPFSKSKPALIKSLSSVSNKRSLSNFACNIEPEMFHNKQYRVNFATQEYLGYIWEIDGIQPLFPNFPLVPNAYRTNSSAEMIAGVSVKKVTGECQISVSGLFTPNSFTPVSSPRLNLPSVV